MRTYVPKTIHLVGSIGLDTVEDVFRTVGMELGPYLKRIPDGEVGGRKLWISWQYPLLRASTYLRPDPSGKVRPTNRFALLTLAKGVASSDVHFGELGYAREARASYLDFIEAPDTWDELVADGAKLTKRDAAGNVSQWAVEIPSTGFPYWLFQGLTTANNVRLMNQAGTETYFDKPEVIQALQFWVDLSRKDKIEPQGTIEWGTTPKDFFERKTAIMWTSTGNLTNVRSNAGFPFGVAMLPAHQGRGSPTGGGNFYLFKKMTDEERTAAFKFVRGMTTPERAADWGIATGYVAVRPDAWDTPAMKKYVADFPAAAVARDQLKYAVAELSTHDNQRVTKALNDGIQAALTGTKTPEQAMKDAQQEAARILRASR